MNHIAHVPSVICYFDLKMHVGCSTFTSQATLHVYATNHSLADTWWKDGVNLAWSVLSLKLNKGAKELFFFFFLTLREWHSEPNQKTFLPLFSKIDSSGLLCLYMRLIHTMAFTPDSDCLSLILQIVCMGRAAAWKRSRSPGLLPHGLYLSKVSESENLSSCAS